MDQGFSEELKHRQRYWLDHLSRTASWSRSASVHFVQTDEPDARVLLCQGRECGNKARGRIVDVSCAIRPRGLVGPLLSTVCQVLHVTQHLCVQFRSDRRGRPFDFAQEHPAVVKRRNDVQLDAPAIPVLPLPSRPCRVDGKSPFFVVACVCLTPSTRAIQMAPRAIRFVQDRLLAE
jgi:hypothetical protein